jgi:hypothetical protein
MVQFKEVIDSVINAHKVQEDASKLGIHLDPWDNYLYYDSKFILDCIFNKKFYSTNEKFLLVKFLLFVYYNDMMSNFRIDGKILVDKLITFVNKKDEEKTIDKFINKLMIDKIEPNEEEIDKFETSLEVKFDLFLDELTRNKQFSETKNDYFNI